MARENVAVVANGDDYTVDGAHVLGACVSQDAPVCIRRCNGTGGAGSGRRPVTGTSRLLLWLAVVAVAVSGSSARAASISEPPAGVAPAGRHPHNLQHGPRKDHPQSTGNVTAVEQPS